VAELSADQDVSPDCANSLVGVVAIDGLLFAIPIKHVREVIPAPEQYQRLPSQHPELLGAVLLRGKAIPVQSLHCRLGTTNPLAAPVTGDNASGDTTSTAGGVIVVVRAEGRVAGLLVDAVRCLLDLGDTWAQNLPDGQDPLISGGYICDTNGHFSMLSVSELLNVPQTPSDEISETARRRARVQRLPYIRFRVADKNFLIAMQDIASTVPTSPVTPWPINGSSCLGLIQRHGMEMPMLDTLENLGLASAGERPDRAAGIIIEYPDDHALAFHVDQVVSVMNIEAEAVYDFPPSVTSRSALFSGVHIDEQDQQCLVINVTACRSDPELLQLAATSHRLKETPKAPLSDLAGNTADPSQAQHQEQDLGGQAGLRSPSDRYLTVSAGCDFAVPIEAVSEIMRLPVDFQHRSDFDGHLANLSYHNRLMPVYDCARRRGHADSRFGSESGIMILQKDGHHFGLAVEAMRSIDIGRIKGFRDADGAASACPSEQLVELGFGATKRLVAISDPAGLLP